MATACPHFACLRATLGRAHCESGCRNRNEPAQQPLPPRRPPDDRVPPSRWRRRAAPQRQLFIRQHHRPGAQPSPTLAPLPSHGLPASTSRMFVPTSLSPTAQATFISTLNFVDLAGSERASKTGAEVRHSRGRATPAMWLVPTLCRLLPSRRQGIRHKEGCHINRSLLSLGTVIRKLAAGAAGVRPPAEMNRAALNPAASPCESPTHSCSV